MNEKGGPIAAVIYDASKEAKNFSSLKKKKPTSAPRSGMAVRPLLVAAGVLIFFYHGNQDRRVRDMNSLPLTTLQRRFLLAMKASQEVLFPA